ncbi:MAG: cytochrome c-type biogenesis protein CcmH [Burkholderiales bacterium]|jgi:cytochrome c-type biogenesis protein CcmH|nr:cytochrome c-type biogenesis protein CcmH [Burkholderiales bacterium]
MNPTPEEIERLQRVSSELRCLVCQNQSIAESTAGLAVDLKQQALEQIQAGKSDEDIRSYMVERYGEFILYKPAFSASNAVLWGGPFVLLALVFVMVVKSLRRRQQAAEPITQATDVLRAAKLEERYKRDASNQ